MENRLNSTVREMRKNAVIETFFKQLATMRKSNPAVTIGEVIKRCVKMSAPRFYVTFENARRIVSQLARKQPIEVSSKNKVEMYKEIYRRYKKRAGEGYSKYSIIEEIIEEPAPSFYIDINTFQGILYKTIRKRRKEFNQAHCQYNNPAPAVAY